MTIIPGFQRGMVFLDTSGGLDHHQLSLHHLLLLLLLLLLLRLSLREGRIVLG